MMAFYAEIYGYIARKEAEEIPVEAVARARQSAAIFQVAFSAPVASRMANYSSFACDIRVFENEAELWLVPFEKLLQGINFLSAVVHVDYEEAGRVSMKYAYLKMTPTIKRYKSEFIEQTPDQSIIG